MPAEPPNAMSLSGQPVKMASASVVTSLFTVKIASSVGAGHDAGQQKGRSVSAPAFLSSNCEFGLLHTGRDFTELGGDFLAQGSDSADNDDGDKGGDQSVLDGGGAGLIFGELRNELGHGVILAGEKVGWGIRLWPLVPPTACPTELTSKLSKLSDDLSVAVS